MRLTPALLLAASVATVAACADRDTRSASADSTAAATAGTLPDGEHYLVRPAGRTWYRVSGGGPGIPAIVLHGGPGYPSFYMKGYERLGDERTIVRYDQLGCGKSDHVTDTTLFTPAQFVDELEALRRELGFEKVHLVGLSWGSMLAFEYYRAHPEHVQSMTLAGAPMDIPAFIAHTKELVATLPDSMQRAIRAAEAAGDFTSAGYQAATEEFYGRYVWLRPDPADLDSTISSAGMQVYEYMWGPSELTATGPLKDWNVSDELGGVTVPVLYTVGEYDEMGPELVRRYASQTPGSRYAVIPDAAHLIPWDNLDSTLSATRAFLRDADGRR